MERQEAIRANQDTMNALARISEEIGELDKLIFWFGQARYFNPTMVRRLSRTKARLLAEKEALKAQRAYAQQFI